MELGIEALLFARADVHNKMAHHRFSRSGTNAPRQSASGTPHQGSEPQFNCFMRRSSSLTQPRAKGHRLASPHEPNFLNTNTRIVPSSSALTLNSRLSKNAQPNLPLDHANISSASRGVACSHKPREGGASACSTSF